MPGRGARPSRPRTAASDRSYSRLAPLACSSASASVSFQRSTPVAPNCTLNVSPYLLAALFYLVITIPLGRFVQQFENRLAASEGGGAVRPADEVSGSATVTPVPAALKRDPFER